jgi:hypothetical protein
VYGRMKSGEMIIGQIAKLILAVVVVILLLTLAVRLFSPMFDRDDETAKSYLETLKREIALADSEEGGEFFIWYLGDAGINKEFYLVYFGEAIRVDFSKTVKIRTYEDKVPVTKYENRSIPFNSFGTGANRICICTMENLKSSCNYCENLDYPVSFVGKGDGWYEKSGKRISIKLEGDRYVFTEI